jgi:hypothetical protein
MSGSRISTSFGLSLLSAGLFVCLTTVSTGICSAPSTQDSATKQSEQVRPEVPRGMRLILTDGTYQVIREYQRDGERVKYYSLERGAWEEIPASMVDWDATAQAKEAEEKTSAALVNKVHKQEEGKRMDNVTDVDASLRVGEGVFLPSGEGMFVVEGKTIRLVQQVGTQIKTDKARRIEQVLSPVPLVPGKKNVSIPGTRATLRLRSKNPEFFLREVPSEAERDSGVIKSSRPGDTGPEVLLLRAKVTRNARQFETIKSLFGEAISEDINQVSVQRWEVAPMVYRFTLSEALPPGEYVLTELLPDGLNMYVWDFGLDEVGSEGGKK